MDQHPLEAEDQRDRIGALLQGLQDWWQAANALRDELGIRGAAARLSETDLQELEELGYLGS